MATTFNSLFIILFLSYVTLWNRSVRIYSSNREIGLFHILFYRIFNCNAFRYENLRISIISYFCNIFLELNKDFYLEGGSQIINTNDQDIYNKNQYWITQDWPYKIRLFKIDKKDFTTINQIETIIYYFIIFLLVVGFISYGGEIRDTLKKSKHLSWIDVITDTDICRLQDRKSFFHYLKVGMGLHIYK